MTAPWACMGLLVLAAVASACSPGPALCAKKQECGPQRDATMDDESRHVCEVAYNAGRSALRENSEKECQVLGDAVDAYDACRATLACDDFLEPDLNGQCKDEADEVQQATEDAKGECASTD